MTEKPTADLWPDEPMLAVVTEEDAEIARLQAELSKKDADRAALVKALDEARAETARVQVLADSRFAEVARLTEALAAAEDKYNRIWRALDTPSARYAPMIGAPNNYIGMVSNPEGAWCRCEDVKLIVALASEAKALTEAAEQKLAAAEADIRTLTRHREERNAALNISKLDCQRAERKRDAAEARCRELSALLKAKGIDHGA